MKAMSKVKLILVLIIVLLAVYTKGVYELGRDAAPAGTVGPVAQPAVPLNTFIGALMDDCGGTAHSPAKRKILSEQIERAADKYLTGTDRHAFVALLCLETRMGTSKLTSRAGAMGVAQIMPGTAKAEAERCGLGPITPQDLLDNEVSLQLGACHYAALVKELGSSIAPLGYNGGSSAEAVKLAQRLIPGGAKETLGYSAVHSIIMARYLTEKPAKASAAAQPTPKPPVQAKIEAPAQEVSGG